MFKRKRKVALLFVIMSVLFLVACVNDTSFEGSNNFAEATEVKELYLDTDKNIKVIDARGVEAYEKGHLKNAISISPGDLVISEPVKATVAEKEQVEKILSENGIDNDTSLFIYDDKGGVYSARVWWTLKLYGHKKVKIINNGAKSLEKLGLEMSANKTKVKKTDYKIADKNMDLIASLDDVKKYSENPESNPKTKLVDVRSIAEFEEGYIPGALFYPHTNNYYSDGSFKSARDTFIFYKDDLNIERDDEVILYCKSSYRATVTMALLDEAGFKNVKVFDGAWLAWQNESMPSAEVEENAPITESDGS